MDFSPNNQISGHLHKSTTVWTQPATDEQRSYYSKHAAEKRVFGWITTLLQTAHGAVAFAAWTAIYLWVFKNIPFLLPTAPFLAGGTLIALHILFRTTWQTYWYDRLDDDPNTDSPIWVPIAIIILLLGAEIQGARQYLAGQVAPIERHNTDDIDGAYRTEAASIEQAYRNDAAAITDLYKTRLSPFDRQIAGLRARSADTDEERRNIRARIAAIQSQRDQVIAQKAEALKKALDTATDARSKAAARRDALIDQVDNHNAGELARYTADMGSVSTYAWLLSVGLLALICGLSYRTVRINVRSGILPLRNYTILDAHGSVPERIWTAFADAFNRRGLQFAVWIHRLLSPNDAITSFDGTVVARPGTYNTPEGFYPASAPLPAEEEQHTTKTEQQAAAEVLEKLAGNPGARLTPDQIRQEIALSLSSNGHYRDLPLQGGKPEAPAGPQAQPAGATRTAAPHPTYAEMLARWTGMMQNQLDAYDQAVRDGKPERAASIQDYVMSDPHSPLRLEGRRLNLEWGIKDGEFVVRRRDRDHFVPLADVTEITLEAPKATSSDPHYAVQEEELFKQTREMFKQTIIPQLDDAGRVIGIKYRKEDGSWTAYNRPAVEAQYRIYQQRAQKEELSQAVQDGLGKWQYALSLFEEGEAEIESIQPIIMG